MRIAVTGSNGFIGTKLVQALINKGHDVISLDMKTGVDITDWNSIKNINNFNLVIHLAAISYVPKSYEIPREMFRVNINGTLNMLELCRLNNARFIFTSSYVYGRPKYLPIDELHPIESFNPYCQSKIIGENLCNSYNKDFGVPIIIFRPFNIFGEGQNENFIIPLIQKQINENGFVNLRDPRPKRDFIHVNDVVDAFCKAVEYKKTNYEIFNLGSGISYSVKEIAEIMVANTNENIQIKFSEERRQNEVLDTIANINKAKQLLNWFPKNDIRSSLKKIITQNISLD